MSQQHRQRYDGNAEWYEELFARYGDLANPLSSSSLLARLLGPGEGRCLDVACGGGLHHEAIASTGRTIVGVDLSSDQLRVARRRGRAALVRGSAAALPFTDESFPIVVCEVDQFATGLQNPIHLHEYRGHFIDVGMEVGGRTRQVGRSATRPQ